MPKVYLSWFREASSVKADFKALSLSGMYAMITASSADLKSVMFFESRIEMMGSGARLRKETILRQNRFRFVLKQKIGESYSR
jgi:hypothetical protein